MTQAEFLQLDSRAHDRTTISTVRWFVILLWVTLALADWSAFVYLNNLFEYSDPYDGIKILFENPYQWILRGIRGAVIAQITLLSIAIIWMRLNIALRVFLCGICLWGL